MTETEWLACNDPAEMLIFVESRLSKRKLRLVCCAFCRGVVDWCRNCPKELLATVETAERFADGQVSAEQLIAARQWVASDDLCLCAPASPDLLASNDRSMAESFAALLADRGLRYPRELLAIARAHVFSLRAAQSGMAAALREVVRPHRSAEFDRRCLTPRALQSAGAIYEAGPWERLFDLANELQSAGCTDDGVLSHFRRGRMHARGCWALDLVLDRE